MAINSTFPGDYSISKWKLLINGKEKDFRVFLKPRDTLCNALKFRSFTEKRKNQGFKNIWRCSLVYEAKEAISQKKSEEASQYTATIHYYAFRRFISFCDQEKLELDSKDNLVRLINQYKESLLEQFLEGGARRKRAIQKVDCLLNCLDQQLSNLSQKDARQLTRVPPTTRESDIENSYWVTKLDGQNFDFRQLLIPNACSKSIRDFKSIEVSRKNTFARSGLRMETVSSYHRYFKSVTLKQYTNKKRSDKFRYLRYFFKFIDNNIENFEENQLIEIIGKYSTHLRQQVKDCAISQSESYPMLNTIISASAEITQMSAREILLVCESWALREDPEKETWTISCEHYQIDWRQFTHQNYIVMSKQEFKQLPVCDKNKYLKNSKFIKIVHLLKEQMKERVAMGQSYRTIRAENESIQRFLKFLCLSKYNIDADLGKHLIEYSSKQVAMCRNNKQRIFANKNIASATKIVALYLDRPAHLIAAKCSKAKINNSPNRSITLVTQKNLAEFNFLLKAITRKIDRALVCSKPLSSQNIDIQNKTLSITVESSTTSTLYKSREIPTAYFCERGHRLLRSVDTCTSPSNGRVSLA